MRYQRVADEAELIAALSDPSAAILAGGTDLLVKIRGGLVRPGLLVDIGRVPTLRGIRRTEGAIEIGAAVPESDVLASPDVRDALPLLAAALRVLGSVQIRNRGTLGGNLVNASPAADSAIPLLLYDAELVLVGGSGERTVPLEGFFVGPGRTALGPGEFIRTVRVPIPKTGGDAFYHKVGKRRALTIAIASLGALLRTEDGRFAEARLAAGSVAPTPIRLRAVEERLRGASLTDGAIAEAKRLAIEAVSPISDVRATAEYRSRVVGDLVARALRAAGS
jgi:CO/xanthine dehydrogenase FAD-binding subunit